MRDDAALGCIIPLAQAIVTGALTGLTVAAGLRLTWMDTPRAMLYGVLAAGLSCLATWFSGLATWRRSTFPELHHQTWAYQTDTTIASASVRVELAHDGGRRLELIDLPVDGERLRAFAHASINGASMTEAVWTGSGGLFTRAEFARLREELIRRGLACWNSPGYPARGCSLTRVGHAVMRRLASPTLPDTSKAR